MDAIEILNVLFYIFVILVIVATVLGGLAALIALPYYVYRDTDFKKPGFMITYYLFIVFIIILIMSFIYYTLLNTDSIHVPKIIDNNSKFLKKNYNEILENTDIIKVIIEGYILYGGILFSLIILLALFILLIVLYLEGPAHTTSDKSFMLVFCFIVLFYVAYIYGYKYIHFGIIGFIISILAILDLLSYTLIPLKRIFGFFSSSSENGIYSYIKGFFVTIYDNIRFVFDVIQHKINEDANVKNEFYKQLKNTGIFLSFFSLSIIALLFANNDNRSNSNLMYFYTFLVVVPIILGIYMSSMVVLENDLTIYEKIIILISFLLIFGSAYCYSYHINPFTSTYIYSFGNVFLSLIVIIFLGITFIVFSDYLKKQRGFLGFIVNLIFFIPCLFTDFVEYMKQQIGITPNIVYIMFILELLVIITYIYLPSMIHLLLHNDSVKLKKNPYYLKNKNVVAYNDVFKVNNNNELNVKPYLNNNYSFSFWFYLNPDSKFAVTEPTEIGKKSLNEKNIFDFANGRPKLVYINDEIHTDMYRFYLSNQCNEEINSPCSAEKYKTNYVEFNGLPKQRWNFIVINYGVNTADVFVNGNLKGSIEFKGNNNPNDIDEKSVVTIGDDSALDGAIKEIYYYKKALSKFEIVNMYNLFNTFGTY